VEQYKPFARQVYTIQSCYLEGLADLLRLHFAITGEFDYNTPFVLSMRFPAEDMGDEKRDARQSSLDLAQSVVELVSSALGLEEGEPLPEDIIFDILSRYTFLDETDVLKWMRYRQQFDAEKAAAEADGGDDDEGGGDDMDFDMDDDMGGDDMGGDEGGDEMMENMAARKYYLRTRALLREKRVAKEMWERKRLLREKKKVQEMRFKRLREQYGKSKKDIYFTWLKENAMQEWKDRRGHQMFFGQVPTSNPLYETFKALTTGQEATNRLKEAAKTLSEILDDMADGDVSTDPLKRLVDNYVSPNDELTLEEMSRSPLNGSVDEL
jgi:hypothetical protein